MKKIIILFFALSSIFYAFSQDADFKSINAGKMQLSWKIEKNNITFKITALTTGWVAIGINPSKKMKDADFIIGYVDNGNIMIEDDFGVSPTKHKSDVSIGGKNNIISKSGSEKNNTTELTFTIPLDSGDQYDKKLIPGNTYNIILAYSLKDNFTGMHKFATEISIKL